MKKLAYIDAIRGFAILAVIAVHSAQHVPNIPFPWVMLAELGQYGVQMFFVASALTLCLSSSRRTRFEHRPIANFFTRRYFRIAPMYYVGLALYFVVRGFREGGFPPADYNAVTIMTNLTFTHGWSEQTINYVVPGGWSIAVEFTFYALFPLLFKWLSNLRRSILVALGGLAVSFLALFLTTHGLSVENNSLRYFWFFTQFPVFCLGIVLFHVLQKIEGKPWFTNRLLAHLGFFGLFGALAIAGIFSTRLTLLLSPFVFGLAFVAFALALSSWHNPIFVNRITTGLGKLSYSLYLTHFIFAWYVVPAWSERFWPTMAPTPHFLLTMFLVTVFASLVSLLTYSQIELRFMGIGKNLIKRREQACETP